MAVKFDKELLLKHYFWIVSGVFLLLILILVVMEAINTPGTTEKTAFESGLKSVQGLTSGFKNDSFLPPWEARFKEYEEDKNTVWAQAWAPQSTIYDWPDAIRERETIKDPTTHQPNFPVYPNYFPYAIRDKSKGVYLFPLVIYPNMNFTDDERREYKDSWYSHQFDTAWTFMNTTWKNPINDQDTMKSTFLLDQQGDVLQPGLPFRLAVSGTGAPMGGMGDGPGGGGKMGGPGMSMPGGGGGGSAPISGAMPGMAGMSMPGMGGPGGANAAASPADAKGAFMAAMRKFTAWQKTPSKEEIWILQEDYWIRRELLSLLRESVASIATFHPVPGEHPVPAGASGRYKAANAFWELDLIFENGGRSISKKSTIRNVHIQQRPQPIADPRTGIQTEFAFYQNQFRKVTKIKMDGEVLPFGKGQPFPKEYPNEGAVDFNKPFDLVQIFYPGTSPIRVLDSLELPFNSHRTTTSKLVARSTLKKEGSSTAAGATGAPGTDAGVPASGGDTGGSAMGMPGMTGPGASRASSVDLTPYNKQLRSRYMISNKQCRHVPFAMKLTLDQSTLPTLITALTNSKLRIQVTQVQYQYIPFSTSSSIGGMGMPGSGPGGMMGGKPGPGMGSGGYPGMGFPGGPGAMKPGGFMGGVPGGFPAPGGGGLPGASFPGGAFPGGGRNEEGGEGPRMADGSGGAGQTGALADGNLIDVAIYGIAVLYERFPPPKENPADAANATAEATPAPAALPPSGGADRDK